jgi:sulfate transport system ATP-binding protein
MAVTLNDIVHRFGDHLVVNRVSLEVADGELFVLLGSSGSGKSTVLRIIAGLLRQDSGEILVDGRDVGALGPQERGIGFVFQNYAIFKHMTVAENVEFGLRIRGVPASERSRRREELLELVALSGLDARYPAQLSGGQRQRVALARALAYKPSLLLLDEPFGALDVRIRSRLRQSLKDIQRQLKVTTILVTHDQEEAFELADRIGVLERGRLVEVGTPEQLYHRPKTEFTAHFVGGGNVLVGRSTGGQIRLGEALIPLPPDSPPHAEGAPVRIVFRPESVRHQSEPFSPDSGLVVLGRGRVERRMFAGASERVRFAVKNLQGVRPPVLSLAYGQGYAIIEAAESSLPSGEPQAKVDETRWLGVERFHVLQPSSVRVLAVVQQGVPSTAGIELAGKIALASHGAMGLAAAIPTVAERPRAEELLAKMSAALPIAADQRIEGRVRIGSEADEIAIESQRGYYDIVTLSRPGPGEHGEMFEDLVRHITCIARVPVLLALEPRDPIKKILICTAGGEPGKGDVSIAARIARHTDAAVCVFSVRRDHASPEQVERVKRHLNQARATLDALSIPAEVKIGAEPVLEQIVLEAEEGKYDIVVIGASGFSLDVRRRFHDLSSRLVAALKVPVMIVPMRE